MLVWLTFSGLGRLQSVFKVSRVVANFPQSWAESRGCFSWKNGYLPIKGFQRGWAAFSGKLGSLVPFQNGSRPHQELTELSEAT